MPGGPYFLRNSNISLLNRLDANLKRLVAHLRAQVLACHASRIDDIRVVQ